MATQTHNSQINVEEVNQGQGIAYDLRAFGALGNDTNEAAIITSVVESMPDGATLHIPYGTFNLNGSTLFIRKPMTITGVGKLKNGTIIIQNTKEVRMIGVKTEALSIEIASSDGIEILGCTFANLVKDVYGYISISTNCQKIDIIGNDFSNIQFITSYTTYGCAIKFEATNKTISNVRIHRNTMKNIYGPAAIWIGGSGTTYHCISIKNNIIRDTYSFGIEFFQFGDLCTFKNCVVDENEIYYTGSIRTPKMGNGCGGVFVNSETVVDITVKNNILKNITECGIEGGFILVEGNYIEDTGCDQLNHPIQDSSGIYGACPNILNNIIINPGANGGMYYFSSDVISGKMISGNTIRNQFEFWEANTAYKIGDQVVSDNKWYTCVRAGTSGNKGLFTTDANIVDGSCRWNYKKPLAKIGVRLNAINGISNVNISNNEFYDVESAIYTSGWNKDITIYGNVHHCSKISKLDYIHGYGSRVCDGLIYKKPSYAFNSIPTQGTWLVNDVVENLSPKPSGYLGWICTSSGTFGTLSGVTGSIVSGSVNLTVNKVSTLKTGEFITITGVTGVRRIYSISGNVVTIDLPVPATVTNAVIRYSAPVFKGYGAIQA